MNTTGMGGTAPDPAVVNATKATTFKGHPQDPPAKVLQRMYNFLADDDPNRSLKFTESKLPQIEEYLEYVQSEDLVEDNEKPLLKKVITMAKVQRDWIDRADAPPRLNACKKILPVLPYSSRLLSIENARKIQEEQEQWGLDSRMRQDHAPFTVERSSDQKEFFDAMLKDAQTNPDQVNEEDNLLYVEGRAYNWALNQPSLIPYWTHRNGLPNEGQSRRHAVPIVPVRDPNLPDYLKEREDVINGLLQPNEPSNNQIDRLKELLYMHEPEGIKQVHNNFLAAKNQNQALAGKYDAALVRLRNELDSVFIPWLDTLRASGVAFRIKRGWMPEFIVDSTLPPGNWYFSDLQPSEDAKRRRVHRDEQKINELIKSVTDPQESFQLQSLLGPYLPDDNGIRDNMKEAMMQKLEIEETSLPRYNIMSDEEKANFHQAAHGKLKDDKVYQAHIRQHNMLLIDLKNADAQLELRYRRHGELVHTILPSPDEKHPVLYKLWDPDWAPLPIDPCRPDSRIEALETQINDLLYRGKLDKWQKQDLEGLLRNVMPSWLRQLAAVCDTASNLEQHQRKTYLSAYENWCAGLRVTGASVRIPLPGHTDLPAGVLLYRETMFPGSPPGCNSVADWARQLNLIRPNIPEYSEVKSRVGYDLETERYYMLLRNLQYPVLQRMHAAWVNLPMTEPLRGKLKERWENTFFAWVATFRNSTIEVRQHVVLRPYPPDDPSIVYYRGPLNANDVLGLEPRLPDDIQKDEDEVRNLLNRVFLKLPLNQTSAESLERLLSRYWLPGKEYAALKASGDVTDSQKRQYEFSRALFLRCCKVTGFRIIMPWNNTDELIAHDPSTQLPPDWMPAWMSVPGEQLPDFIQYGGDYKKLLDDAWRYPKKFYETISSMENGINRILEELRESPLSDAENYARIEHLLRPFFNPNLRQVDQNLRSAKTEEERVRLREVFNLSFCALVRRLKRHSENGRVSIREVDNGTKLLPSEYLNGVLYFYQPYARGSRSSFTTRSVVAGVPGQTPAQFRALESDINELLRKFHYQQDNPDIQDVDKVLTWEDDDNLRRKLRAIMNHNESGFDAKIRELEDQYREGMLEGRELANYLTLASEWRQWYDQWVSSMPRGGIYLRELRDDSEQLPAGSGTYYIYIKSPDDLPPRHSTGPDSPVPWDIAMREAQINMFLREPKRGWGIPGYRTVEAFTKGERDFIFLLYSTWTSTYEAIRKKMETTNTHTGRSMSTDKEAVWEGLRGARFLEWLGGLVDRVRKNKSILQIHEPRRNYLVIQEKDLKTNKLLPLVQKEIVNVLPTIYDRVLRKFQVISRQFHDIPNEKDKLAAIVHWLRPRTYGDAQLKFEDEQKINQVRAGQGASDPDATLELKSGETVLFSELLKSFADAFPEDLNKAIPRQDYVDPLEELVQVNEETCNPYHTYTPPRVSDDSEVREVEILLGNMLYAFQDGGRNFSAEKDSILNFLIRPLLRGDLGLLFRETTRLIQKAWRPDTFLTTSESLALEPFLNEFKSRFEQWKHELARHGACLPWYLGTLTVNRVLGCYRELKKALRGSNRTSLLQDFSTTEYDNPIHERTRQQLQLLRSYIEDPDCFPAADLPRLALQYLPQSVASVHQEWLNGRHDEEQRRSETDAAYTGRSLRLRDILNRFIDTYAAWFAAVPLKIFRGYQRSAVQAALSSIDFSAKAERRGVKRAAIELGLNLLATNQEQHRPFDRFRRVKLQHRRQQPLKECPLWQPIPPHERPVEMDSFEYTKRMREFRRWKEGQYTIARGRDIEQNPNDIPAPENYHGPQTDKSEEGLLEILSIRQKKLIQLQQSLMKAQVNAPRPLIRRVLELIDEGMQCRGGSHHFYDGEPVKLKEIEVLKELTEPSWAEFVGQTTSSHQLGEFQSDIYAESIWSKIPFWEPAQTQISSGEAAEFGQQRYDQHLQSTENAKLHLILEAINAKRATKGLAEWNIITATELVREMAASTCIHYDGRGMVARIPPDGHPENKYVVSEAEAGNTSYITENKKSHEFEVTYDSSRTKGPPILQPNKYEYYQRIAFKVGSEIGDLLVDMSEPYDTSDRFLKQKQALQRTHQITDASTKRNRPSLQSIALELHERAPNLAAEVPLILAQIKNDPKSLSDADAATLIQMELIQEANNNWESRFPETEHVWNFAAPRLVKSIKTHRGADVRVPPRQYFDMRRWPLSCQSTETQTRIKSGGLKMEEPPAETKAEEAEQDLDDVVQRQNILDRKPPVERHTGRGQVPLFPFGETLYQRGFMSFRMDKELEDVEDFNPKPPRDRWSKFKRNFLPSSRDRPTGSTALPEVKGWVPDSISREEKRLDLAERQMKTPGYPDEEEFYFNSSEIEKRRQRGKFHSAQKRQFEAREKVVDWYREREGWNFGALQYDDLTDQEKRAAWSALDIDPLRQVVRTPPSSHGGLAQPPTTPLGDSGDFARSTSTPPRAPRKRRRTS